MSIAMGACFICGGEKFDQTTSAYRRCAGCGHETLLATGAQGYILNDPLTVADAHQTTALDAFKARMLERFDAAQQKTQLLDIGSASGKFLLQNGEKYTRAIGIEVTPAALEFSRNELGLNIVTDIDQVPPGTSVATAWHSLEHIPEAVLLELLDKLAQTMTAGGRLIVSVPNGASRQYRWFRSAYAYFDVPNHLHQFSTESLEHLLRRFGFHPVTSAVSWPYNSFGYIQGLLNIITRTHNYLYYRLKRRSRKPRLLLDCLHLLLLPLCVPVGWILGLLDAANVKTQGVITICFEKARA